MTRTKNYKEQKRKIYKVRATQNRQKRGEDITSFAPPACSKRARSSTAGHGAPSSAWCRRIAARTTGTPAPTSGARPAHAPCVQSAQGWKRRRGRSGRSPALPGSNSLVSIPSEGRAMAVYTAFTGSVSRDPAETRPLPNAPSLKACAGEGRASRASSISSWKPASDLRAFSSGTSRARSHWKEKVNRP